MSVVDNRGRVFGRWNLFDAVLVLFAVGLVPLAYGAYALFRTPLPVLTAVEPATLQSAPNMRVTIRGENLRPYLRVSFGTQQGQTFLFKDITTAEVTVAALAPGTYDVVLFDQSQERSRLPKALTVTPVPLPNTEVTIVGSFANLTKETAPRLTAGTEIPGLGSIVAVGSPLPESTRVFSANLVVEIPVETAVRLPAVVRARCQVRATSGYPQCAIDGVSLDVNALLMLRTPLGTLPFQVDQLRGLQPIEPMRVRVRLSGPTQAVSQVRPGDVDRGAFANELAAGATVLSLGAGRSEGGQSTQEVELMVQAQRGTSSWTYAGNPLRAGGSLTIRTSSYELSGMVLSVAPSQSPSSNP